jgi:hypothetical protein
VFRPVLYCRDHPARHRFPGVAGTARAVRPDAALAHHRDAPVAGCSDDTSEGRRPGACLASRRDAMDNVAKLKVRQQDAERLALPRRDVVLPLARFPVLQPAAVARQAGAQTMQTRRRVVQL